MTPTASRVYDGGAGESSAPLPERSRRKPTRRQCDAVLWRDEPAGRGAGAGKRMALEDILTAQIRTLGLPEPVREHRFCDRRWRFDLAYPDRMLAIEVEGGVWSRGRHVRARGYEEDCIKYSQAAILGWRVIRVTPAMVQDGRAVQLLRLALGDVNADGNAS